MEKTIQTELIPSFDEVLNKFGLEINRKEVKILQINMGKLCNQVCSHCHIEAGPKRTEIMTEETVQRILELLDQTPAIHTVDITGGAPEMNPNFKHLVQRIHKLGKSIIVRCNLTVLLERGQEDTIDFFKSNSIKIASSLPCYSQENVDAQRGNSVFEKSILALQKLNQIGYGKEGSGLLLDLVYNPGSDFLPPDQGILEQQYKEILKHDFGIEFNRLFTITNMPIKRFEKFLKREHRLQEYQNLLFESFNSKVATEVMCTELISIGWDGKIYDCDFNQALEMPTCSSEKSIWEINKFSEISEQIVFGSHCFGCTAGSGSSCGGALN